MNEIETTEKPRTRRSRRFYRGGLFWPVILITIGVLFLLKNFNVLTGDVGSTLLRLWPVLLILMGLDSLLRGHGLAGPVFLIGLGVVLLFNNFGHLPWNAWEMILRLWPVLIIAIGLDIIIGRRSAWGSLLALVLMLSIVAGALLLMGLGNTGEDTPVKWNWTANITQIDATLNPAIGSLRVNNLMGGDSLAEGVLHLLKGEDVDTQQLSNGTFTIKSKGNFFFLAIGKSSRWKWDLNFTPSVPIDLTVNMGVGEAELDLNRLRIAQLDVSLGVGKITVVLPAKAMQGKIDCAIGETVITVPRGVEVQVKVNAGITSVDTPSSFTHNGDYYTSAGYHDSGATRIDLEVDQAIGHLEIKYEK
jgi:hypothetical protein